MLPLAEVPSRFPSDRLALVHGGARWTLGDLDVRSAAWARTLAARGGWESVGDCGHVDADGYLFLDDRRQDLVIQGGVNVWPAEVKAALSRHPEVRSCAVFGEADADLGQRIHAVVETGAPLTLAALRAFLGNHLSRDKWPRALTLQTTPVRDDAGKFRKTRSKAIP